MVSEPADWIDEPIPGTRLAVNLLPPTLILVAFTVGLFYLGFAEGIRFLRDGLTFRTNGFWQVSFAAYLFIVFVPGLFVASI